MKDNPKQIADHLVEQQDLEGALDHAISGIAAAHAAGDYYRLSIWREVRRLLRARKQAGGSAEQ